MSGRRPEGGGGRKAPPPGRAAGGLLLLLALLLPFWLAGSHAALAHATLLSSEPAAGARLAAGPEALVLLFDEPVQLLSLQLLEAEGEALELASEGAFGGARIELPLTQALPAGRFLVSWRAASLDGHVIGGSFAFVVGEGALPQAAAVSRPWTGAALRAVARVLLLLALGSALFEFLRPPPSLLSDLRRRRRHFAVAGIIAQLAFAASLGGERAGLPAWQLWQPAAWQAALAAPGAWLQGLTLLGLLLLALPPRPGERLLLPACLAAPASLAASGHVLAHLAPGMGQGLMLLHGLAVAAWIGALLPLRQALLQCDPGVAASLFRRFQSVGLVLVAAVLASGLAMALVLLPRLDDLWRSDYGLRLLAKLVPVALMLAIALVNRLWLTRRALTGERVPRRRLARVLRLDLAAAVLAVVLAAGLSLGPPPAGALRLELSDAQYGVQVTLAPGRIGDNSLEVTLARPDGTAFDPQQVSLRLAAPAAGVEPWEVALTRLAPGLYRLEALPLWIAGPWNLRLRLLIDDFTRVEREASVTLR